MFRLLYQLIKVILLLILPFACLIRGATYLHEYQGLNAVTAISLSALGTVIIGFIYFSFFYGKLTGKLGDIHSLKRRVWIIGIIVIVYCLHGIFFFSSANLKSKNLGREMRQLHPILRLSLSTLIYFDQSLIITDAGRHPEDYSKMGLPKKSASLHYPQASSQYVHAVDIRTKGRSILMNSMVQNYFRLMGFRTLRHTGTEDHLHVSLMSHDHPHAK